MSRMDRIGEIGIHPVNPADPEILSKNAIDFKSSKSIPHPHAYRFPAHWREFVDVFAGSRRVPFARFMRHDDQRDDAVDEHWFVLQDRGD